MDNRTLEQKKQAILDQLGDRRFREPQVDDKLNVTYLGSTWNRNTGKYEQARLYVPDNQLIPVYYKVGLLDKFLEVFRRQNVYTKLLMMKSVLGTPDRIDWVEHQIPGLAVENLVRNEPIMSFLPAYISFLAYTIRDEAERRRRVMVIYDWLRENKPHLMCYFLGLMMYKTRQANKFAFLGDPVKFGMFYIGSGADYSNIAQYEAQVVSSYYVKVLEKIVLGLARLQYGVLDEAQREMLVGCMRPLNKARRITTVKKFVGRFLSDEEIEEILPTMTPLQFIKKSGLNRYDEGKVNEFLELVKKKKRNTWAAEICRLGKAGVLFQPQMMEKLEREGLMDQDMLDHMVAELAVDESKHPYRRFVNGRYVEEMSPLFEEMFERGARPHLALRAFRNKYKQDGEWKRSFTGYNGRTIYNRNNAARLRVLQQVENYLVQKTREDVPEAGIDFDFFD